MEQRLNIPFQQVWMFKLMGLEFEIQYKEGAKNVVVEALSKNVGVKLLPMLLDNTQTRLLEHIKASWSADLSIQQLIYKLQQNAQSHPKFT